MGDAGLLLLFSAVPCLEKSLDGSVGLGMMAKYPWRCVVARQLTSALDRQRVPPHNSLPAFLHPFFIGQHFPVARPPTLKLHTAHAGQSDAWPMRIAGGQQVPRYFVSVEAVEGKNPTAMSLREAYDALWRSGFSGGFTWRADDYATGNLAPETKNSVDATYSHIRAELLNGL
eukprot:332571-Pleurochrysis_carterae.AAC.1